MILIFIMLFLIQLVYSKCLFYVDLFNLSRIFEKGLLARVNIRHGLSLVCCFLWYNAFCQSLRY